MNNSIYKIQLEVKGGSGGDGRVSFKSTSYQPRGGPDGGDGGNGGNVRIKADEEYHSLEHLHNQLVIKAQNGSKGGTAKKHGKNGENRIIKVPPGTMILDAHSKDIIRDLKEHGEEFTVVKGGDGGRGNMNFPTPSNQSPRKATKGKEGQEREILLVFSPEIDVAVVGPPNSGKSTLISALTDTKPGIKDYPYSTREAHLWTCVIEYRRYIFLDTPPLVDEYIEDISILVQRASLLIVVMDAGDRNIKENYRYIDSNLLTKLKQRNSIEIFIVINKMDTSDKKLLNNLDYRTFYLSLNNPEDVKYLKNSIFRHL